jgi:hypothetical protein
MAQVISETQFLITAKDLASKSLRDVGALQNQVVNDATSGQKRLAAETNNLTGFIRRQRAEQREQTFLFRQSREVVGTLAIGLAAFGGVLGESDRQMRVLNSSLQQGFLVFQGLDFALASINPTIGVTVAILGGLTAAFATFASSSKENTASINSIKEKILDLRLELGELSKPEYLTGLTKIYELEKKRRDELAVVEKGKGSSFLTALLSGIAGSAGFLTGLNLQQDKTKGTTEEILQSEAQVLSNKIKQKKTQEEINEDLLENLILNQKIGDISKLQVGFIPIPVKPLEVRGVKQSELPEIDFSDTQDQTFKLLQQFDALGNAAVNVNSLIISSTQGAAAAITDAFFGATESIQQFFENMVKNIIQLMVEQLLIKGILSVLGTFIPGIQVGGGLFGTTSGIGSNLARASVGSATSENLSSRTITIQVNGSTSEANTEDVRRTMKKIERAIFTERGA